MDEEFLKKLGLSIARGVPQMATGMVDLAALPFTMTGLLDEKDVVGGTEYLTQRGLLPPAQEGLLNETAELVSGSMNPSGALNAGLLGLGTLIGKKSPLWNKSATKILGPDGIYRQEISDKLASLIGSDDYETAVMQAYKRNIDSGNSVDSEVFLKDVFDHPELFKAYPDLENYKMRILDPESRVYAKKGSDMTMHVRANATPEDARSSLLHEAQHHIQENEGFARGGSVKELTRNPMQEYKHYNDAIGRINQQMKEASGTPRYSDLIEERDALIVEARLRGVLYPSQIEAIAIDKYKKLGGEAEARLVQARRDMSTEELAAQPPFDPKYFKEQTGVDIEDLIFQGLLRK